MRQIRRTRTARFMGAAKPWTNLKKAQPASGRSYLIAADYNGVETFDVAYYNGLRADGFHWWTLANVEIDQRCITHFSEISEPDKVFT